MVDSKLELYTQVDTATAGPLTSWSIVNLSWAEVRSGWISDMKLLPAFILLQLMDVATTIVALNLGAAEQNPVIGRLIALGPIPGLIMSKLVVIGLAALFLTWGKTRALRLANIAFGVVVTWNLTIIGRLAWLT
jgi:uncharacterized protein DUF5658